MSYLVSEHNSDVFSVIILEVIKRDFYCIVLHNCRFSLEFVNPELIIKLSHFC